MRTADATVILQASTSFSNALNISSIAQTAVGGTLLQDRLNPGVSSGQINRVYWADNISLAQCNFSSGIVGVEDAEIATPYTTLDLTRFDSVDVGAGDGKDAVGMPFDVEEIVMFMVRNHEDSLGDVLLQTPTPTAGIPWIRGVFGTPQEPGPYPSESNRIRPGAWKMWYEPGESGLDVAYGAISNLRLAGHQLGGVSPGTAGVARAQILILGRSTDSLDLTATFTGGESRITVETDSENFVLLRNSTGLDAYITRVVLQSAGGYLVPVEPGDLTADANPFSELISNSTSNITYNIPIGQLIIAAGTSVKLLAKYVIP